MSKKVLDVGQCPPDHMALRRLVESFGARMEQVALPAEALELLKEQSFDLVFVNRKIDLDYTDGIELVRMMKENEETREIPVMVISNFEETQDEVVALGGERGFGKSEIGLPGTRELLARFLT